VRANWKMLVENETDGYHPQFVHASIFSVAESGIPSLYGEKSAAVCRDLGNGHTENDLRRHKRENARRVVEALPAEGGQVLLDADDVQAWLKVLTDVRLSLGTRMGLETEEDVYALRAAASRDESLAAAAHIYEWLTHVQENLVQAVWRQQG